MIRTTLSTAALLLMLPSLAVAQNSNRKVERIEQKGNRLEVVTGDGVYLLTPYSDRIMETVFVPKGEAHDPRSHAVVMAPAGAGRVTTVGDAVQFATAGISATITRAPFGISYAYKGKPLVAEKNGYTRHGKLESIDFALTPDEALYGGGAARARHEPARLPPSPLQQGALRLRPEVGANELRDAAGAVVEDVHGPLR